MNPKSPRHFLVVPKKFSTNLIDIDNETLSRPIIKAKELALQVIHDLCVDGFKVHINNGANSQQEVFRTHVHIIPSKNNLSLDIVL
ncbi:HIT domain-containing protein [Candidatus Mycoplasma mahonii]|uniref:HIT domain-containing protein n=1 Tax=Candidatus Mycoplasma mahonii TaxID=3004105 RepID=UPI003571527A